VPPCSIPVDYINRNGKAEILTFEKLSELLEDLPHPHRLIAAICYYTSCRVSEAISLKIEDVSNGRIVFRRANTKQKRTKEVSIPTKLQAEQIDIGGILGQSLHQWKREEACHVVIEGDRKGVGTSSWLRDGWLSHLANICQTVANRSSDGDRLFWILEQFKLGCHPSH
jgi:hypothetical protein